MKISRYSFILLLLLATLGFWGCKKNSNPAVGFNPTTVNLNAQTSPKAYVTIQLSKTVNENVEIWLEQLGPDTLQFGSLNTSFLNDDSNRISGALNSLAVIDTPYLPNMAHLVAGFGASSLTLTLNALFDNFAKRAVQYRLKIYQVNNGTIQSGNDVLTINIASQPMVPIFSSSMYIIDPTYGTNDYTLSTASFTPNPSGTYNFDLSYSKTSGLSPNGSFSINFSNITPSANRATYTSDDGFGVLSTHFQLSKTPSSSRGNYYIMNPDSGSIIWANGIDTAKANLGCTFVDF